MNYKKYAIVDLHLHLDGSLSAKAIIKAAKADGITLPSYDETELNKLLMVPENCGSLNEYLERFALPNLVLQTEKGLEICTLDLLNRLAKDGLKYVEIRMAPQLSTNKGLSQEKVVETLLKTMKIAEKSGIFSNLILCMMRGSNTHEKNFETIKVASKFMGKGVVAMDLAGAEALFPNEMFGDEFNEINKLGLPLTIHSGEAVGASSVSSALNFNPQRIGHGIHSITDDKVVNELVKRNVCLEICPKSNLDTKAISKYEDLPIQEFLKKGVRVTINTDNMTVSNTTLKEEYETLVNLGFNEENLKEFARNSIDYAFCDNNLKAYLLTFIE